MLETFSATSERVWIDHEDYKNLTDCLDILCNDTKNSISTVCSVLEIEIDTDTFETYLLIDKLNWVITVTQAVLVKIMYKADYMSMSRLEF